METLYKKYPGDNEVASFYSLALNGWGTTEQQTSILEAAAKIGYEVLQRNPKHPGALHYIIHAYDNPDFAALAFAYPYLPGIRFMGQGSKQQRSFLGGRAGKNASEKIR